MSTWNWLALALGLIVALLLPMPDFYGRIRRRVCLYHLWRRATWKCRYFRDDTDEFYFCESCAGEGGTRWGRQQRESLLASGSLQRVNRKGAE